jgi:prepilin-type N-terminal cleavage/methylation domain-containing protein
MRRAFTLVELIVASIIGVMVAGAVLASVSSLQRARAASLGRSQAFGRADAAAAMIALDAAGIARNADLTSSRVAVVSGGSGLNETDDLMMLCRSLRPVRGGDFNPEGDEFEVQYRVASAPGGVGTALWRRVDPALDDYLDAGGVATAVVNGVVSLSVQASDGTTWFDDWNSDSDGIPHALSIVVVASSDDARVKATARRIVAMDRVPLPPASTSTTTTSGTGTTSGGGGSGGGGRS